MEFNTTWTEQSPFLHSFTPPKEIGLKYLRFLSDDFGIWQHSLGEEIDRSQGYALDDAARALWVANAYRQNDLQEIYFNFIKAACLNHPQPVNFFNSQRQPVFTRGFSLDALGQVGWIIQILHTQKYRLNESEEILTKIKPYLLKTSYLRSTAYQLLSSQDSNLASSFAHKIMDQLKFTATDNWYWPELSLTYGNAILPWSMFKIAQLLNDHFILDSAQRMLDFVNQTCVEQGKPSVVGNKGWYPRGGIKQQYDQQPIDVAYLILANLQAYQTLKKIAQPGESQPEKNQFKQPDHYLKQAWFFYSWYWGNNLQNQLMLNLSRESVYDGLTSEGYSTNQGAENIITFLMSQFELRRI